MTVIEGGQVVVLDDHVLILVLPGINRAAAEEMSELLRAEVPEWRTLVLPWAATVTDLRDDAELAAAAAELCERIRDRVEDLQPQAAGS